MAEFRGPVLRYFSDLFRTAAGPSTPREIDVSSPVQPVADVSRVAARGVYIRTGIAWSHAGASTVRDSALASSVVGLVEPEPITSDVDAWLVRTGLLVDAATVGALGAVRTGVRVSNPPGPSDQQVMPLASYNGFVNPGPELIVGEGVAVFPVQWVSGVTDLVPVAERLPVLLRPDEGVGVFVASESTGVVTFARLTMIWWIGPRGATPPGMS